jgi:hypothetical protein
LAPLFSNAIYWPVLKSPTSAAFAAAPVNESAAGVVSMLAHLEGLFQKRSYLTTFSELKHQIGKCRLVDYDRFK